jgi:hypothetical protein
MVRQYQAVGAISRVLDFSSEFVILVSTGPWGGVGRWTGCPCLPSARAEATVNYSLHMAAYVWYAPC